LASHCFRSFLFKKPVWLSLNESSKARPAVALVTSFGSLVWFVLLCELLKEILNGQASTSLAEEIQFSKIATAYERLTDNETQSEWTENIEFVSSNRFLAAYYMSGIVACAGRWPSPRWANDISYDV
jgi:hypothetical protein